ncbi:MULTISPECIES: hypothetical protein [Myxococcus]|uniref:Uncharacterized protein n=1 Tax=Myxococcus llanfairpwllgwyngyllgogerychwyrndrobwllllantysiliogogogochensis TaxID=2590453 RepID=A0A540X791_9BACT|nr:MULTISPECIES: hypothetical protein [Myxococcus]NTX08270.1 hypothetical protein [Myxococcus sp. CA040A]NTX50522.1 hypothetical protein [Myxococcus sp. CA039A]TQF17082.1 hypothetical protein FJV41_05275 [Myxococcus llanfairpwllgwyngyllgogerychwyrndrobwllllantysiliogogogochensis]
MRDVAHSTLSLHESRSSAAELVRSILPILYGVDERPPRAAATKHYHPDATFQDPLLTVQGIESIRRLVYVNRTFLTDCRIVFGDVAETVRPDGSHVVLADVTCTLVFKHFLLWRPWQKLVGDSFTYQAVHKVVLDEDLKVTAHEEHFSVRSVLDTVPVGRALYALLRKVDAGCTSDFGYTLNQYIAGDRSIRTVL